VTKSRKIFLGIIVSGIGLGLVGLPLTKVLLGSYPVAVTDVAPGESHPDWKDGVYIGRSVNQRGETEVLEVMIAAGRIHHIRDLNDQDTSIVSDKVLRDITPVIIRKNSVDVDTVSGATVSSQGIIAAVNNALEQAANQVDKSRL
jgi:uncharacterized protein with FMN-binding domain